MERYDFLRQFHAISSEDYQLLEARMRSRSFKKGAHLVTPGQVQKELYFVKSGVQMSYFETDKKMHVIAFAYPPNLCAIPESFSLQQPSQHFLTCMTDSELDYIKYEDLQQLFDQSQALERLFRKMTEIVLAGVLTRHIELQASTIKERYLAFCQRSPHLLQLVPHKYIASYLGIDPTNFSKLYNTVRLV